MTIERHGGFTAGIRRVPQVIDTFRLPESTAEELAQRIAAASSSPAPPGPGPGRDGISYIITVDQGGATTTLRQSDGSMSPEFAELVEWLDRFARSH